MPDRTTPSLRRLLAACLLVALAPPLPAAASHPAAPTNLRAVAAATPLSTPTRTAAPATAPTAAPATPVTIDDERRLAVLVRIEISRRHEQARSDVFAVLEGLEFHLPSAAATTVGFHEAKAEHLALEPHGDRGLVMPSRGREGSPTSAVDIVIPAGEDVLAPVSGRILAVSEYLLYGERPDVMLTIIPDGRPDLVVTIYHLADVKVRDGQRIEAGDTVLAGSARVFDFVAQVEEWGHGPHIDLRVRRA